MASVGRPQDEWQAELQIGAHGVRADGLWSAFETLLLAARQNGKGGFTEGAELAGIYLFKEPLIMHSAHLFKTSRMAFKRIIDIVDGSDWLRRRVKSVSRSKSDESIELLSRYGGGRIEFVARTERSGRGLTGSITVFDEAEYLTIAEYAAQTPALGTIPNPRIIYTGTPPDEDVGPMPEDAMLPSVRRRGLRHDERTMIAHWVPPKGFDRTDRRVWALCNPSLNRRVTEAFLARQLLAFTDAGKPEKFDTEHLCVFPDDEDQQWLVIPEQAWRARQEHWAPHRAPVAFCLEASLDRTEWTVAVAARRNDGLRQAQLAHLQSGSSGLVDWLVERQRKWRACALVVDAGGPAGTLIADLEAAGLEILKPAVREYAAACGSFADGIAGAVEPGQDRDRVQDVRCTDQEQLTAAVAGLSLRKVAELNVFERAGLGFRASAIALALWGLARKGPAHYDPLKSVLVAEVGW